jgi:integrase
MMDRLDLQGVHFHSLRHTFATRCVEVGFEIKSLSEILGHKNPTVTLNRYVHSLMEHKRAMMDKLGKIL